MSKAAMFLVLRCLQVQNGYAGLVRIVGFDDEFTVGEPSRFVDGQGLSVTLERNEVGEEPRFPSTNPSIRNLYHLGAGAASVDDRAYIVADTRQLRSITG